MFNKLKDAGYKLALVGGTALAPVAAFAQDASFDETSIITKITTYGGKAVLIIGAFLLAVWGLRALGILGKR